MERIRRFRPRAATFNGQQCFVGRDGQRYFYTDNENRSFAYLGALADAPPVPSFLCEMIDEMGQALFKNRNTGQVYEYRNNDETHRRVQLDLAILIENKRLATETGAAQIANDKPGEIEYII
jgi:hypothetical protein